MAFPLPETDLGGTQCDQRLLARSGPRAGSVFMEPWSWPAQHVSITKAIAPYTVSLFNERRAS